jgi:pimeloyl-ACP methyl ester carboxylesterase
LKGTAVPGLVRDNVRLVYDEAGAGDPPMVFIHGWTCDRSHFALQVARYAAGHRCLAVDLRGHGQSDAPEQDYTIEGFADDVAWMCDQLGVNGAVLVGHSMGGAVVLALAAARPDLACAMAMLDPAILFPPEALALIPQLAAAFGGPGGMDTLRQFEDGQFFRPASDAALKQQVLDAAVKTPQHVVASAFANIVKFDAEAALCAVRVPIMNVDADPVLGDHTRLLAASPGAVIGRTVGSGHFHQLEVPDQIDAMLDRFLAIAL